MRMSNLFIRTLRESPSQAVLTSHKLLTRAGYIQEMGKGGYAILPFGLHSIQNMEKTFLSHIGIEASVLELPLILSHEGNSTSEDGLTFNDKQKRQLSFAAKADAIMDEITQQHFTSYRQLPAFVTSHDTFWDEDVHPGSGPLYSRLPRVLSLYGFFQNSEEYTQWQEKISTAIDNCLGELDIPFIHSYHFQETIHSEPVEWFFRNPAGKSRIYRCPDCGYIASEDSVQFHRQDLRDEPAKPLEKIKTPDCKTIDSLAAFLNIPKERTAKAVFLTATLKGKEQLLIVIIPGNRELDEQRLAVAAGLSSWRPATEEEILKACVVPGYGSAINIKGVYVVVDTQIPLLPNLVAGANEPEFHLLNVNYGRDYTANLVADITHPQPGDTCPKCHTSFQTETGVKIASIWSPAGEHVIMDAQGKMTPLHTLACCISSFKLLAAIAETHYDEHGLIMPITAAPFDVHLVLLPDKEGMAQNHADELFQELLDSNISTLYDDRNERAGVKFNDADLIGIPIRITVSQRSMSNGIVEVKLRRQAEPQAISRHEILPLIRRLLLQ